MNIICRKRIGFGFQVSCALPSMSVSGNISEKGLPACLLGGFRAADLFNLVFTTNVSHKGRGVQSDLVLGETSMDRAAQHLCPSVLQQPFTEGSRAWPVLGL